MSERMTAHTAAKFISPRAIERVHFQFTAEGGCTGWLRVPKIEAKRMLRTLLPGAHVSVDIELPDAYIRGQPTTSDLVAALRKAEAALEHYMREFQTDRTAYEALPAVRTAIDKVGGGA